MRIAPLEGDSQRARIKSQILELDRYAILIFVSQNAVEVACEWIDTYWPQWPVEQTCIAIGQKTAARLAQYAPNVVSPKGKMDSASVLALPELQNPKGKSILIFRGVGGLPTLGQTLEAQGAGVGYCELYQRIRTQVHASELSAIGAAAEARTLVVSAFSGETLMSAMAVLAEASIDLKAVTALVPGVRVAELAREGGFGEILCAQNATDSAMLEALKLRYG